MATLAGIDLGTTYSALAVLNDAGEPEIVPTANGDRITPSAVAFNEDGTICVGYEAKNRLSEDPEHVVQFVKRKMGEPDFRYNIFGKKLSPIDISSMILKKLKEECNSEGDIRDVIITIPAAFNDIERKSTIAAGEIAGLNVLGLVNEPTAAAVYYGKQCETDGNVLVYDLGGGTFDVTILKISGGDIRVLTSKGDIHLGGVDFDHAIVKIVNEEIKKTNGNGLFRDEFIETWDETLLPAKDRAFFYKLMKKAEQLKKTLSSRPSATMNFVTPNGENISQEISRETFEENIIDYIATTEMLIESALENINMSRSKIDKILLVGGSTRVPCVQKSIERLFKKSPEKAVNVDEAVALGAAIYSAMSKIEQSGKLAVPAVVRKNLPAKVVDVNNTNFGVLVLNEGGQERLRRWGMPDAEAEDLTDEQCRKVYCNSVILKKNLPLPCKNQETYYTASRTNEIEIDVSEYQEYTEDPTIVNKLGKIEIKLPQTVPMGTPILVSFAYDKNQCLHIFAECEGTVVEQEINHSEALSPRQIKRKMIQLQDFEIID